MTFIDNLPHRCTIRKRVRTKGTLGGSKDSFTNVQTNVECWEQPAGDRETLKYQQLGMDVTHAVYFKSDPTVKNRHQIFITSRQGVTVSSPIVLDVKSVTSPDATAGLQLLWKVMCSQVTAEDT